MPRCIPRRSGISRAQVWRVEELIKQNTNSLVVFSDLDTAMSLVLAPQPRVRPEFGPFIVKEVRAFVIGDKGELDRIA